MPHLTLPQTLFAAIATMITINLPSFAAAQQSSKAEPDPPITWHTTLEEALAAAQETGKPVLMEINGRPWCPPCNQQGEKIIDTPEFEEWASENVVLLDIKVGQGYDKQQGNPNWFKFFKHYQLAGIPAAVLLDQQGNELGLVLPKPNVQQWLGAANNIIHLHGIAKNANSGKQVIPFRLTPTNSLSVPARLNGTIALNLMLHTAVSDVSLIRSTIERFPEIKLDQTGSSESWGGKTDSRFGSGHSLSLAGMKSQPVTVFEDRHTGHGTDGKFGPDQLNSNLFAIDFDRSEIQLLTRLPADLSNWHKVGFELNNGIMFVTAKLQGESATATQKFMVHSGYSGFALLDNEFVGQHPFLNQLTVLRQDELTDSAGNKLTTQMVSLPKFEIAGMTQSDVPVSFFSGQLGGQRFSVLGGDFLKRFNVIFDLESKQMYLQPSRLYGAEYFIAEKK